MIMMSAVILVATAGIAVAWTWKMWRDWQETHR